MAEVLEPRYLHLSDLRSSVEPTIVRPYEYGEAEYEVFECGSTRG
jgi:hypothetical protein